MQRRSFLLLMGLVVALASSGCYRKVVKEPFSDLRSLDWSDDQRRQAQQNGLPSMMPQSGWTIILAECDGNHPMREASYMIKKLQEELHLNDVWVRESPRGIQVCRGHFSEPRSPIAQQALRQTRMLQLDGGRPFKGAEIMPLGADAQGAASPFDLRQHKGMFSLQIGYYDEAFGKDFRKAAEQAAAALRADGVEAYYYHGVNRSMLTVGVFTRDDWVQVNHVDHYGPRIKEMQDKYPYNLANGLMMYDIIGGQKVPQTSFIVEVR